MWIPTPSLGLLPDEKINDLKKVIEEASANLPVWMMNRRKDVETGQDKHVMGMDLAMTLREDLDLMKKMRSYKGIRHERGLRVRGQRTRSTGRTGAIVGVSRKKEGAPAAAAAAKSRWFKWDIQERTAKCTAGRALPARQSGSLERWSW